MNKYSGKVLTTYISNETIEYKVEVYAEDEEEAIEKARNSDKKFDDPEYGDVQEDPGSFQDEVEDLEVVELNVAQDVEGNWIDEDGNKLADDPTSRIPGEAVDYDMGDIGERFGNKMPDFIRRAQMTTKKRFIENLYNLKSSLADVLRGDEQYLEADIKKLRNDARRLNRADAAFEELGVVDALTKLLDVKNEMFDNDIDKYKRLNNFYNKYVVKPIRDNVGLFGLQLDLAKLNEKHPGSEVVQPSTMKISPDVPSYLKLKSIPEISDEPKSPGWHNKLDDVDEMLRVLGGYIPEIEDWLRVFKVIDKDTTKIISLENNEEINANIAQAAEFYALAGQISSRMKTAKIMAARAGEIIYTLEELPKEYFLSPSQNRELVEVLWNNYLASGHVDNIVKRVDQLSDERSQLVKKFRQVYEQWSVLYEDTAKQVGVDALQPIKLQLVRYGQAVISAESILQQMRELDAELAAYNEKLHALTTDLYEIYIAVKKGDKGRAVAQLRTPAEPSGRLEAPIQPEVEIPEREVPAKPPKLPVGDEWLSLVFEEDMHLYYSKDEKLTPPQTIAMAGRNGLMIAMQYQKASNTGDPEEAVVKNYMLEPYSYRIKTTKKRGRRKYLFAYDTVDSSIKAFLVGNIRAVQMLPEPYVERWEVEFY